VRAGLPVITLLALAGAAPVAAMESFEPSAHAAAARALNARVRLEGESPASVTVLRDDFGILDGNSAFRLPPIDFAFAGDGKRLVPLVRGPAGAPGAAWQYLLSPGWTWREAGAAADSALMPFSLFERNANCLHYGFLRFDYSSDGQARPARWRIAGETCQYLKFDARGTGEARVDFAGVPDGGVLERYAREREARLERRTMGDLAADYPGADPSLLASREEIDPADLTTFGFVIDGVHYSGGCNLRTGRHPGCEDLPLPSYSLAKSLVAGLGLMAAESRWPASRNREVADLVPECGPGWAGVTLEHLLDMATGRYEDPGFEADENALLADEFFLARDHATKLRAACERWPRRERPGQRWVYHTTDSYLLGTALTALVERRIDVGADFYRDLLVEPAWQGLGLSPLMRFTRRTEDAAAQPFTGWGLVMLADDLAKIGAYLAEGASVADTKRLFNEDMLSAALQRDPSDPGLPAGGAGLRYNNGFWAWNAGHVLGCNGPLWIPFMSGYGGIVLALFPNGTSYYYVSDGGTLRWRNAAIAAHAIRPMCDAEASTHE